MEAGKTDIAMGNCIKMNDIERVGANGGKLIDKSNCRLMTENVVREK